MKFWKTKIDSNISPLTVESDPGSHAKTSPEFCRFGPGSEEWSVVLNLIRGMAESNGQEINQVTEAIVVLCAGIVCSVAQKIYQGATPGKGDIRVCAGLPMLLHELCGSPSE
jgi:hypothetical protein